MTLRQRQSKFAKITNINNTDRWYNGTADPNR